MTPQQLYELYLEAIESEGLQVTGTGLVDPPWDQLKTKEKAAWSKLCHRLQNQHGLR